MKGVGAFQKKILDFYAVNRRDLPWRKTTNPYFILLSEVMLQQTQVERGIRYYDKWTTKWPTVFDLAAASRTEVLTEWMGLGYNNRAVNLHKAAQLIVDLYEGDVILAMQDYKNVPGVGPYISAAVQIFSLNRDIVTVDTNIRRILIHEFGLQNPSDQEIWNIARECLPKGKSRDWHNALMDYGSSVLTARKTGISPKTKQSKFEGSTRQIRAKVLRLLLASNGRGLSFKEIDSGIKDSRLQSVLDKMVREGMSCLRKKRYCLCEK